MPQAIEKVGIEQIVPTNRAWKAPKPVCLVADLRSERALREFFNRLLPSLQHHLCRTPCYNLQLGRRCIAANGLQRYSMSGAMGTFSEIG